MNEGDFGLALISAPNTDYSADLVFVHGLDGHRSRSWKNEQSEFWPQWISQPAFLPQARVWTYGYNAKSILGSEDDLTLHATTLLKTLLDNGIGRKQNDVVSKPKSWLRQIASPSTVANVTDKPIVFIAHSLGGIVVKMAMLLAHESGKAWSYIFQNTVALVFMGTPHRGSRWANRLFLFATSSFRTPSEFLHLLRAKSSMLSTLADRFNNIWGKRPILSLRETTRVSGIGMIVCPNDAVTNCQCEQVVDVAGCNHITISKPDSTASQLFQTLITQVTSCTKIVPRNSKSKAVAVELGSEYKKSTIRSASRKALLGELRNTSRRSKTGIQWNVIEEDVEGDTWVCGSYWCFFPSEGDEFPSTTIFLETDPTSGNSLSWSIRAPQSLYYPGTHSGTIEIARDYPFSQPWLRFSTPIFSPYVHGGGGFSSAFDMGQWNPIYTIMDILHSVAAMIVLDPFCHSSSHHLLPGIPLDHHELSFPVGSWSSKKDSFIRATNFFSRAYLQGDIRRSDNPPITEHETEMSIIATQELLEHFTGSRFLDNSDSSRATPSDASLSISKSNDPAIAFKGVKSTEEWIAEENWWADAISLRCGLGLVDDNVE